MELSYSNVKIPNHKPSKVNLLPLTNPNNGQVDRNHENI